MAEGGVSLFAAVERARRVPPRFLDRADSPTRTGLEEATAADAATVAHAAGVDGTLLDAALDVRAGLGRLYDLVHAVAILLVLPRILDTEERMARRPSRADGNDPVERDPWGFGMRRLKAQGSR